MFFVLDVIWSSLDLWLFAVIYYCGFKYLQVFPILICTLHMVHLLKLSYNYGYASLPFPSYFLISLHFDNILSCSNSIFFCSDTIRSSLSIFYLKYFVFLLFSLSPHMLPICSLVCICQSDPLAY